MNLGYIKWFNEEKGFGFIYSEFHEDLFFNHHSVNREDEKFLKEHQPVAYEITNAPRGLMATDIRIITEKELEPSEAKHDSDSIIQFLKMERENLLHLVGENLNEFNQGRIYAMDKVIDGLEGIYNNL